MTHVLKILNLAEINAFIRERPEHKLITVKGPPPSGATYSDGILITHHVDVAWIDSITGEQIDVVYEYPCSVSKSAILNQENPLMNYQTKRELKKFLTNVVIGVAIGVAVITAIKIAHSATTLNPHHLPPKTVCRADTIAGGDSPFFSCILPTGEYYLCSLWNCTLMEGSPNESAPDESSSDPVPNSLQPRSDKDILV